MVNDINLEGKWFEKERKEKDGKKMKKTRKN
jgi:hypothetical protein